ncbi:MAG: DUF4266 domain-containing protein [Rhodoferax sp.]|nr:DUF4266 domain-containing protein [Rhodoferax sp.]
MKTAPMHISRHIAHLLSAMGLLLLGACSPLSPVNPWEKGNLAKPMMAFEADPVAQKFVQHVYTSKESASGGYAVGGGGCGCN